MHESIAEPVRIHSWQATLSVFKTALASTRKSCWKAPATVCCLSSIFCLYVPTVLFFRNESATKDCGDLRKQIPITKRSDVSKHSFQRPVPRVPSTVGASPLSNAKQVLGNIFIVDVTKHTTQHSRCVHSTMVVITWCNSPIALCSYLSTVNYEREQRTVHIKSHLIRTLTVCTVLLSLTATDRQSPRIHHVPPPQQHTTKLVVGLAGSGHSADSCTSVWLLNSEAKEIYVYVCVSVCVYECVWADRRREKKTQKLCGGQEEGRAKIWRGNSRRWLLKIFCFALQYSIITMLNPVGCRVDLYGTNSNECFTVVHNHSLVVWYTTQRKTNNSKHLGVLTNNMR